MTNEVQFHHGSYNAYKKSTKHDNILFFTDDTHQVFKGDHELTKSVKIVSELPSIDDGEYGSMYLCDSSIYIFDGISYYKVFSDTSNANIDIISNSEIDSLF